MMSGDHAMTPRGSQGPGSAISGPVKVEPIATLKIDLCSIMINVNVFQGGSEDQCERIRGQGQVNCSAPPPDWFSDMCVLSYGS